MPNLVTDGIEALEVDDKQPELRAFPWTSASTCTFLNTRHGSRYPSHPPSEGKPSLATCKCPVADPCLQRMSSLDNTRKRIDLERKALVAEEGLRNGDGNRAQLDAAINAAELYMQALRLADNLDDKERLDTKTKGLIFKAEQIKKLGEDGDRHATPMSRSRVEHPVSSRKLTTRENIILLEGSKLNGTLFKPWTTAPLPSEFELPNDRSLFHDDFEYSLAESQLRHFAGWMRPVEALATIKIEKNGQLLPNEATMEKLGEWDMVQDVAPDCSVIASFCVGTARAEKGHRRVLYMRVVIVYH